MLNRRRNAGVASVNGLLYVVGGDDGSSNLNSVEYYNPQTDTWIALPTTMEVARRYVNHILFNMGDIAPVANRIGRKIFHFKPECSATREWPLSIVQNVSTQWQRSIPTCMTLKQTPTELMTDRKRPTVTFDCIPLLSH